MANVTLSNINKIFPNGMHVIHDINLDIKDGEFMVIVGPSGCAKSTLLRMIAGLEKVSSGDVIIADKICNNVPAKDRSIAMVFQNYALYPHMTVYENMSFGLKVAKKSKQEIKKRVCEAAELLEITELLKRKPKELSGGQCQRVALGRAMVRNPAVFLFDEPLSNLDAKLRVSMRFRISKLHQELREASKPSTMVYVTHDQIEAMTMGERICVLRQGRIMQVDTPLNVYHYPKNKFVAEFIGSPPMNMINGSVVIHNDVLSFQCDNHFFIFPQQHQEKAKKYINKQVYLGIRPEHIKVIEKIEHNCFSSLIIRIEGMGSDEFIYLAISENEIICKRPNPENEMNSMKNFYFQLNMDKCHLFDKETEQNIFYP